MEKTFYLCAKINVMSHIRLGKYNQLEVVKEVDFGVYLNGDEDGEILLRVCAGRYAECVHLFGYG